MPDPPDPLVPLYFSRSQVCGFLQTQPVLLSSSDSCALQAGPLLNLEQCDIRDTLICLCIYQGICHLMGDGGGFLIGSIIEGMN